MKALVLPGGSAAGIREIGCMLELAEQGWVPDIVVGSSVGAIWTGIIADRSGQGWDFGTTARELEKLVEHAADVQLKLVKGRSKLALANDVLRDRWKSYLTVDVLNQLIEDNISGINHFESKIKCIVGAYDMRSGRPVTATHSEGGFANVVTGSKAIPLAMPKHGCLWDWGLVDVAPLKPAIDAGATEIVVVPNHPEKLEFDPDVFDRDPDDIGMQLSRLGAVIVHNTLMNDLKELGLRNENVMMAKLYKHATRYRDIKAHVIWPSKQYGADLSLLDPEIVRQEVLQGRLDVRREMFPESLSDLGRSSPPRTGHQRPDDGSPVEPPRD